MARSPPLRIAVVLAVLAPVSVAATTDWVVGDGSALLLAGALGTGFVAAGAVSTPTGTGATASCSP